jgi:hypothetical protein
MKVWNLKMQWNPVKKDVLMQVPESKGDKDTRV